MYDCKAPLSRFYYPETRRIKNAFIIIYYYYYIIHALFSACQLVPIMTGG